MGGLPLPLPLPLPAAPMAAAAAAPAQAPVFEQPAEEVEALEVEAQAFVDLAAAEGEEEPAAAAKVRVCAPWGLLQLHPVAAAVPHVGAACRATLRRRRRPERPTRIAPACLPSLPLCLCSPPRRANLQPRRRRRHRLPRRRLLLAGGGERWRAGCRRCRPAACGAAPPVWRPELAQGAGAGAHTSVHRCRLWRQGLRAFPSLHAEALNPTAHRPVCPQPPALCCFCVFLYLHV